MNNIKAAFDKITPSEKEKKRILNNIINSKKEKISNHLLPNIFLMAMASACFIMMISFNKEGDTPEIPKIIRYESNQIIFEGTCYEEIGIWNDNTDSLEFIKETKEYIMGDKIYKLKNSNSIVIQNESNYVELKKCEGE